MQTFLEIRFSWPSCSGASCQRNASCHRPLQNRDAFASWVSTLSSEQLYALLNPNALPHARTSCRVAMASTRGALKLKQQVPSRRSTPHWFDATDGGSPHQFPALRMLSLACAYTQPLSETSTAIFKDARSLAHTHTHTHTVQMLEATSSAFLHTHEKLEAVIKPLICDVVALKCRESSNCWDLREKERERQRMGGMVNMK